ncbi:Uncharacterised protein [Stutzerimonas stutzeri]|nr:Uncharacterised protein [Stutzerimonas stutzeri]
MGTLVINRNEGQRVRLSVDEGVDAADLISQLSSSGIWLDVSWCESRRQFRLNIDAPPLVKILREELFTTERE